MDENRLAEYWQSLVAIVENRCEATGSYPDMAFFDEMKENLIDANVFVDMEEHRFLKENGNSKYKAMKVDAGYIDPSDNSVHLMIVKYNRDEIHPVSSEDANKVFELMANFIDNICKQYFEVNLQQSSIIYPFVKRVIKSLETADNIFLYYLTNNRRGTRLKISQEKTMRLGSKTLNLHCNVIDLESLYNYELSTQSQEPIVIDVKQYNGTAIPCLKTELNNVDYQAYLAVVPGSFLSAIYKEHGSRLLEMNVRSYLSARGNVNKGIRITLRDNPGLFFTYNNGIACVADDIETSIQDGVLCITKFTNLQIINGGQTTASLRNSQIVDKANLSNVFVPMKLTILNSDIEDEKREELVRNISRYSNSQNKVSASDLSSGSLIYTKIEKISRNVLTPICPKNPLQTYWYFERSRGQYERDQMELTKAKRDAFKKIRPVSQRFKIVDIAKYWNSVEMYPYDVSWGGQINAEKFQLRIQSAFEKSPEMVNEYFYKTLIAKAILFNSARKDIENTSWYKEHLGILAQIAPYTISKMMKEIKRLKKDVDWMEIWRNQDLPESFHEELKTLSYWIYTELDKSKEKDNFAEWCKLQKAWDAVKDIPYELPRGVVSLLVDPDENKEQELSSKREEKAEIGVDCAMQVYNQGAQFWMRILELGQKEKVFKNSAEYGAVEQAIKLTKRNDLLQNEVAIKAMTVQKRLLDLGFDVRLKENM